MAAVLSRLLIGVLGLVLGGALGVTATLRTDPTPFTQADIDRAASDSTNAAASDQAAEDTGVAVELDSAQTRLTRMQHSSEATRADLEKAEAEVADLEKQVASLRAEAAAATQAERVRRSEERTLAAQATDVTGTVTTSVLLGQRFKPWPTDCVSTAARVSVRIVDADGTLLTTSPLIDSTVTKRSVEGDVLTLTCTSTYEATLPAPASETYGFFAVDIASVDQPLGKAEAAADEVADGAAPDLSVKICPGC